MSEPRATRLIVVRHGETDWNVGGRLQGHTDIDLNSRGVWQAEQTALGLRDEVLGAIHSSDLVRARKTAAAVSAACGVEVQLHSELRERSFGVFEGNSWSDIAVHWPSESQRFSAREIDFAPDGGESLRTFDHRVRRACSSLAERHYGQTVLIVAHGGVADCLYRAAVGLPLEAPRSWHLPNASINRFLYTSTGFRLTGWADVSHLDAAPMPADQLPATGARASPLDDESA